MNIKAKIGEKIYTVQAESENVLIEDLKKLLQEQADINYQSQRWVFQGRILSDKTSIKDSNLKDDSCVIVIKSAQPAQTTTPPLASTSSQSATISQNSSQVTAPIIVNTHGFDRAMHILLGNPENVVEDAVGLLLKVTINIINNPTEDKYRRLSNTNAAFSKKVATVPGGSSCMEGLGFRLQGSDWILIPSAEAWEALVQCKVKLDKFMARLQAIKQQQQSLAVSNSTNSSSAAAVSQIDPAVVTSSALPSDPAVSTSDASVSDATVSSNDTSASAAPSNAVPDEEALNLIVIQQLLQTLQSQQATSSSSSSSSSTSIVVANNTDASNTQSFAPVYNTPPVPPAGLWQTMKFGQTLLTKSDGLKSTEQVLAGKKLIGLYFSAHWCPPCRGFTPVLAEFYNDIQAVDDSAIEIIFISSDQDESQFNQYWNEQSWVALPFNQTLIKTALSQENNVKGIPSFVVLNASTGAVVDANARDTVAKARGDVNKALRLWNQ